MNAFRLLAASIRFRYSCASSTAEHSLAASAARSSVKLFSCIAFYPGLDSRILVDHLLDHLGHQVQAVLDSRRRALESFTFDRFGHRVGTQTQRDVFNLFDRVRKRCNAGGIDRLHLLDEAEKIVELSKRM